MKKKHDVQDTLDKAGIERLWKGVSKTNIKDIEELKHASQLRKVLRQKGIKECGEHAVISVLMAFDIINSLYLRGALNLNYEENEYEEICYDPGDS
jgi:hypothetical protein